MPVLPVAAVLTRPRLIPSAVAAAWSLRPRRGVAAWLPVPETRYWTWRHHTAYGDHGFVDDDDLALLLAWRRRLRVVAR